MATFLTTYLKILGYILYYCTIVILVILPIILLLVLIGEVSEFFENREKNKVPDDAIVDAACNTYMENDIDFAITHTPPVHMIEYLFDYENFKILPDTYMIGRMSWLVEQKPDVVWYSGHMHVDYDRLNCHVLYDEVKVIE